MAAMLPCSARSGLQLDKLDDIAVPVRERRTLGIVDLKSRLNLRDGTATMNLLPRPSGIIGPGASLIADDDVHVSARHVHPRQPCTTLGGALEAGKSQE